MQNAINWFEIPVTEMPRAVRFYETVLDTKLKPVEDFGKPMAIFHAEDPAVAGCLILDPKHEPSRNGVRIYLNAGNALAACVSRVEQAGGRVLLPVTSIGDPGSIAIVLDTEGNQVGLHSPPA